MGIMGISSERIVRIKYQDFFQNFFLRAGLSKNREDKETAWKDLSSDPIVIL